MLRDGPFPAFVNAYEGGWSVADIPVVQRKSPPAVVGLLRRAAASAERAVLRRLRAAGIDRAADGAVATQGLQLEEVRRAPEALARQRRPIRASSRDALGALGS